jgi:hypothetical protein
MYLPEKSKIKLLLSAVTVYFSNVKRPEQKLHRKSRKIMFESIQKRTVF